MTAAGAELLTEVPVVVEAQVVADWAGTPVDGRTPITEEMDA
jgi:hypothetical protein